MPVEVGSLDKNLYFGPTFLRGIIYVIAVAIFITIFELCFYIVQIVPLENEHVKHKIHEIKNIGIKQLKESTKNLIKSLNEKNVEEIKNRVNIVLTIIDGKNTDEIKRKIEDLLNSINSENTEEIKKKIEDLLISNIDDNEKEIKKKINNNTKNILKILDEKNSEGINSINMIIDSLNVEEMDSTFVNSIVNTLTDRELELNYKINSNAVIFICLEVFIFTLILIMVYQKLKTYVTPNKDINIGYNTYHGTGILPPIINALLTTIILAAFQLNMFFFAKKWMYITDYEIDYEITKYLSENLN